MLPLQEWFQRTVFECVVFLVVGKILGLAVQVGGRLLFLAEFSQLKDANSNGKANADNDIRLLSHG